MTDPSVTNAAPTPASASSAPPAGEPKLKMPIQVTIPSTEERSSMLKSYTAYLINVSDFGRQYTIERRFDDFQQLYTDVSEIDKNLPAMPEKKMFASTDESVVAERRPAFERILRYCLRSDDIACDKEQHIWKFLELSLPAMVGARYLFKNRRLQYVKQCAKLLDEKYIKDHAYRLCHDSILKTNLHMLSTEGTLRTQAAAPDSEASKEATEKENELETSVIDMVRHAVGQGTAESRKIFLEDDGLAIMWRLQLRMTQRYGDCSAPDDRIRKVLSALIHQEGDRYPEVLSGFLKNGGVKILAGLQDHCKQHGAFAEFIGKALWLAWDVQTQQAFLEGDETGADALGLLGAIFGCGTKVSQILAGLLLSSLIANDLFASNRDREDQAAAGISAVLEELLASMPTFIDPRKSGGQNGSTPEDISQAELFIANSLVKNEKAFARILTCVGSPCSRNPEGVEHIDSAVWSASSFALWCLLKCKAKPARLKELRPSIPLLAQYGPPRVRWLTGELLLQLHCEESKSSSSDADRIGAAASSDEQNAVEAAMSEQINSTMSQLQETLSQNRAVRSQHAQLNTARQQDLAISPDGACFSDLNKALKHLADVRKKLAEATTATQSAETHSEDSISSLTSKLEIAGDANEAARRLQSAIGNVQEIEGVYNSKKTELAQLEAALTQQSGAVEYCRNEMEEADRAVSATRKRITEMEAELSKKQREAQQQRTLATSDLSSRRSKLTSDTEEIDLRLSKLREKAQKVQTAQQAGEPLDPGQPPVDAAKVQEIMGQLKQEATQLKTRRAQIQAELSQANVDPAAAQEAAQRLEQEANGLHDQLNHVRSAELQELERSHVTKREDWQQETNRLQEIRSLRDSLDRECSDLKRQLDERWKAWQPLWSARLTSWHERASALGEAQVCNHRFSESVNNTWDCFHGEEAARGEVLQAVANVQETLATLAQQLTDIGVLQ